MNCTEISSQDENELLKEITPGEVKETTCFINVGKTWGFDDFFSLYKINFYQ